MTSDTSKPRLGGRDAPAAPVRIVHLGLGAFSRAHLAWYTQHATDANQWGIAAYTGRSHQLAEVLARQDGLYTLIVRDADGDRFETISSIVRAHPGDDLGSFVQDIAAEDTAIVTLTITEVGYRLDSDGLPDATNPEVAHDASLLCDITSGALSLVEARPATALVRLMLGLEQRRRTHGHPIAVLSLDNMPDNGGRLAGAMNALAEILSADTAEWVRTSVSFPSSSVDRITPRMTTSELVSLSEQLDDDAPVITEPFTDWVISGDFPAGRPSWESAGARFVDDLAPWEARKLWMLNGAHTLLACLGLIHDHRTVAEAINDTRCLTPVEALWDEDASCLPDGLALDSYRANLHRRFANPRIEHRLEQIAADSFLKLQLRVVPVAELIISSGGHVPACAAAIAGWLHAARLGLLPHDTHAPDLTQRPSTREVLGHFGCSAILSAPFVGALASAEAELARSTRV